MRGMNRVSRAGLLFGLALGCVASMNAQELVQEALSSFPRDTVRVEYSHPAILRSLPNYAALREQYEGPRLRQLEDSYSQLGIQESDVQELVLGWRVAEGKWAFFGLTSGEFDAKAMAGRAAAQGLAPVPLGDAKAYCVGAEAAANCVVLLGNRLGAFGPRPSLQAILDVRQDKVPGLASSNTFTRLLKEAESKSPIWGAATGPAVADWFRGWMPNQGELKLDWTQTFQSVEALTYSVTPGDTVRLNVGMDCSTSDAANSLRQVFEGLKMFQQIAWQNQHPGEPNPFQDLVVQASDTRVLLELHTPYSVLQSGATPGAR
jgi:hypothetical protein